MVEKNENAQRFIAAYNRLDQGLRDIYSIKRTLTFSDMIRKVATVNTVVAKFEEELILFVFVSILTKSRIECKE